MKGVAREGPTGSNPVRFLMEVVRMDEEAVLKTVGRGNLIWGFDSLRFRAGEFRWDRWSLFVWKTKTRVMTGLFRLQNSPQICGDYMVVLAQFG